MLSPLSLLDVRLWRAPAFRTEPATAIKIVTKLGRTGRFSAYSTYSSGSQSVSHGTLSGTLWDVLVAPPTHSPGHRHLGTHEISQDLVAAILNLTRSRLIWTLPLDLRRFCEIQEGSTWPSQKEEAVGTS